MIASTPQRRGWSGRGLAPRALAAGLFLAALPGGCTPGWYRRDADRAAYGIIGKVQRRTLGRTEPFSVDGPADTLRRKLLIGQDLPHAGPASLGSDQLERIAHWPEKDYPGRASSPAAPPWRSKEPLVLSLADALGVAARNNRDYQTAKEDVFRAALALDLEANQFRHLLAADGEGSYEADLSGNPDVRGLAGGAGASWQRRLRNGTLLTAQFAVDLVKLLTQDRAGALGLFADATITIPLLRGAGAHIVAEDLTQAERDAAYALWAFERHKRTLAVQVASRYLEVLRRLDQLSNAEDNYKRLIVSTRRARRLKDAGRLPQIQVDQALQDELRARDRWIAARQDYHRRLDELKITLGLPTDASIGLDDGELVRLTQVADALRQAEPAPASGPASAPADDEPVILQPPSATGGPLEINEAHAVKIALAKRLDLRTAVGRVYDAQRKVVVAADALKLGLSAVGSAGLGERRTLGSAGQDDARLRFNQGTYSLGLLLDVPLERTAERNAYREAFLSLERAVRGAQSLEDEVKQEVREALRQLLQARESHRIQARAVEVAERRVTSSELFLQAGRAEVRDVLEAQEALVSAQNALTAALVTYRVAELQLQRDMGVLEVDEKGNWREYKP